MGILLSFSLLGESDEENCLRIISAVCTFRLFSGRSAVHPSLPLEHSLHLQIYVVHCALGAVAGLRFNVTIKRDHQQILAKLTAETIINVKVNLSGTNSNHCSRVKSSSHPSLYYRFTEDSIIITVYFGSPPKDADYFLFCICNKRRYIN